MAANGFDYDWTYRRSNSRSRSTQRFSSSRNSCMNACVAGERDLIKVQGAQRANRVRLHQALGGSFDAAPAVTTLETSAAR